MTSYHDLAPLINSVLNILLLVLCAKVRAFYEIDNTVYQGNNGMIEELYNLI